QMRAANLKHADAPAALDRARRRILALHRAAPYTTHQPLDDTARAVITALFHHKNTQIGRRFLGVDGDLFDPAAPPFVKKS
ncbi:MAG: hypothetical protein AB3N17_15610, partial [Tateyamaria sp.]